MGLARHSRLRQEDGAIAVIVALLMTMLLGMAALAIDVASFRLTQRQLQAATDAAALAGTYALTTDTGPTDPQTWVDKYLGLNYHGAGTAAAPNAQTGTYCPEAGLLPSARFTIGASDCPGFPSLGSGPNAVRVASRTQSPLYLGRVLLPGTDSVGITATATAAQIPQGGFYAGSGLLSVNGGLINAVLSGVLGSNIDLDAVSYNGLLNANISALSFFQALATNIGVTAGSYGSLLQNSVSVQQVLQAEIDALNAPGSVAAVALQSLQAQISGSPNLQLADLFDLGVWQSEGLDSGNAQTALQTTLNAYQLASLAAQVANGHNFVTVPVSTLGIPGVATLVAATTVIEPPVSAPFVFGPVGMQVHTSQVRLQLQLNLLAALPLGGSFGSAPVSLPIYIEIADGEATLTGISCGLNSATDATVTIAAQPAAARVFIGTVTPAAMSNFSARPTVSPAQLVNLLGILGISGQAELDLGSGTATPLTFSQADIAARTAQTASSTGMLANLLQVLGSHLTLTATPSAALSPLLAPVLNLLLPTIKAGLVTLLQPVFAGLDPLVDGLLAALGIRIGYLDVTATGVRCGAPVLVN